MTTMTLTRRAPLLSREVLLSDTAILIYLVLFKLLIHLFVNGQYGYFRDELAYVDDTRRLAWGYVDHPPLVPLVGAFARALFGDSLVGLRLFAALASAGTIFVAGKLARELGGDRFAQIAAALSIMIAPTFMNGGVLFQTVPYDQLWWALGAYVFVRLVKSENPRGWLALGVVIGLGMMTKYTMAFFAAGLAVGVLLTSARKYLLSPWLWGGALIAVLMFTPHVVWLAQHDWIALDYLRTISARDVAWGRSDNFLLRQLYEVINPITLPLCLAGLYFYFFTPDGKRFRAFGWLFVTVLIVLLVTHGRPYYLAPAYTPLLAAGGVIAARIIPALKPRLRAGVIGLLALNGLIVAPLVLPIAPIGSSVWDTASEVNDAFREMLGWEELTAAVAEVYHSLPPDEQAHTAILAGNYGEAGAINLYRAQYDLPEAISPMNTYWYWSQDRLDADTAIVLGFDESELKAGCGELTVAAEITNRYGVENEESEDHPHIYLCRQPVAPLRDVWADMQRFG